MEAWHIVKEEPEGREYFEVKSEYYDVWESYTTVESKQLIDVKIETHEELYPDVDCPNRLYDLKMENMTEEFLRTEENNNQDSGTTASSHYPKLSIPLVRVEYSRNREVIKYLKPLLTAITSSTELQSGAQTTEFSQKVKTESVELETLTDKTLLQSPKNYHYASPWDFVSVGSMQDLKNSIKIATETELEAENLSEEVIRVYQESDDELSESFTSESSSPSQSSEIQNTSVFEKRLVQKTLNFPVLSSKHVDKNKHNELGDEHQTPSITQEEVKETRKPKFACKVCGKPGTEMAALRRHCRTHNAKKQYECDICKKKFKIKDYLCQHMLAHCSEKYSCDCCSRVYSRKSTLRRHIKLRDAEPLGMKSYSPRRPGSQMGSKNDKNHGKVTADEPLKLYKCDVCGQRFEDESSKELHVEFLHIEIFGPHPNKLERHTPKSSLEKPFQCRTCNKRYTQSSHLKRHQESHLPIKTRSCELCDQRFTTTSSLTRHLLNKHDKFCSGQKRAEHFIKKTSRDYVCKICDKGFRNTGDLRRHCATHDGRKPFECDICNKQFAVKGYLYAHILTHDNWRPYPCTICTKIYRRKSSLKRHINITHSGKKTKK